MRRSFALVLVLLAASAASAGVTVQIVDHPVSVFRYSPVFVTTIIVNHGAEPVLVPTGNHGSNRYFVQTARAGETLEERQRFAGTSGGSSVVWLKPEEIFFFQVDIRQWTEEPGTYYVRVGARGSGRCILDPELMSQFPLVPLPSHGGLQTYECWSGEVASDVVSIDVLEPTAEVDTAALEYARSDAFPVDCCAEGQLGLRMRLGHRYLRDRFPTSHYTYAGAFYNGPQALEEMMKMQPNHSLAAYARTQLALYEMRAAQEAGGPTNLNIQRLHLPPALREYLSQEQRRLERLRRTH